jgi:hypothetical protein
VYIKSLFTIDCRKKGPSSTRNKKFVQRCFIGPGSFRPDLQLLVDDIKRVFTGRLQNETIGPDLLILLNKKYCILAHYSLGDKLYYLGEEFSKLFALLF